LGSELTDAITAMYPKGLDTAVLTGFYVDAAGQPVFFAGLDLVIANQNSPLRFSQLPNAYIISNTISNNRFGFFCAPNFDPTVLAVPEAIKQTFTMGSCSPTVSL